MKRKDFIKRMGNAISDQKLGKYKNSTSSNYSCDNLHKSLSREGCFGWIGRSKPQFIKDYEEMFKQPNKFGSFWLFNPNFEKIEMDFQKQERVGMLELFKEIALKERLYTRY